MARYYGLGIIFIILFLNIAELRRDMQAKIMFYRPIAAEHITQWTDKYNPAVVSLMESVRDKGRTFINGRLIDTVLDQPVDTSDSWSLDHKSSITASQFDAILRDYSSPAVGTGIYATQYADTKGIDNAYVLYMFIHESTAGTAGVARFTKATGNIICTDANCYEGFQVETSWENGFKRHIDLLAHYRDELGDKTIDDAIRRWAPPIENDTQGYIDSLKSNVNAWRQVNTGSFVATTTESGNMIRSKAIMVLPKDKEVKTSTLYLGGCLADTVPNALEPSAALQDFVIKSGEEWSFNHNWTIVNENDHICGDVPYGGVCDMASHYNIAAQMIGMETIYGRHPNGLNNITYDQSVVIWSKGSNTAGGQDLVIKNVTNKDAYFKVRITGDKMTVASWLD